jgi:hypothetical protein
MISPKDKAIELMNRFNNEHNIELKEYIIYQSLEESKRCSLIAVDECLKTCVESMIYYWYEVKDEIEKL